MRLYKVLILIAVALWVAIFVAWPLERPGLDLHAVINLLKAEEGFWALPYQDTRGFETIGYGTSLTGGITELEGRLLLRSRLSRDVQSLSERWPPFWGWGGRWWPFTGMASRTRRALMDMSYQLGVDGVLEFKEMLAALESGDCPGAKAAALDSAWSRETPERAQRVTALLCE